jgi:protein-L-isoaspartate(D-aspartate) O-methyltransferase
VESASTLGACALAYERPDRWAPVSRAIDDAIRCDSQLARIARDARRGLCLDLARRVRRSPSAHLEAVLRTRRERYVLPDDVALSARDTPLPLDPGPLATISAPHAYLISYQLLDLHPGDVLLELGTGTGYGTALARRIVGPTGWVDSLEIDPGLHHRARRLQAADAEGIVSASTIASGARFWEADASELAPHLLAGWDAPVKVVVTYALPVLHQELIDALPDGSVFVAPVGDRQRQELLCVRRRGTRLQTTSGGWVRYVAERHAA